MDLLQFHNRIWLSKLSTPWKSKKVPTVLWRLKYVPSKVMMLEWVNTWQKRWLSVKRATQEIELSPDKSGWQGP